MKSIINISKSKLLWRTRVLPSSVHLRTLVSTSPRLDGYLGDVCDLNAVSRYDVLANGFEDSTEARHI